MAEIVNIEAMEKREKANALQQKEDSKKEKSLCRRIKKYPINKPQVNLNALLQKFEPREVSPPLDKSISENLEKMAIKGLSMPMKNLTKREIFHKKLNDSAYIKNYIKRNLQIDFLDRLNQHIKFGIIYCFNYCDTMLLEIENK